MTGKTTKPIFLSSTEAKKLADEIIINLVTGNIKSGDKAWLIERLDRAISSAFSAGKQEGWDDHKEVGHVR